MPMVTHRVVPDSFEIVSQVSASASSGCTAGRALELTASDLADVVREVTAAGGSLWFRATGHSMGRCIAHGTLVLVGPVVRLERNDVVLARVPSGRLVLHRVVRRRNNEVILCGDRKAEPDPPVRLEDVLGIVEKVDQNGRLMSVSELPKPSLRTRLRRAKKRLTSRLFRRDAR